MNYMKKRVLQVMVASMIIAMRGILAAAELPQNNRHRLMQGVVARVVSMFPRSSESEWHLMMRAAQAGNASEVLHFLDLHERWYLDLDEGWHWHIGDIYNVVVNAIIKGHINVVEAVLAKYNNRAAEILNIALRAFIKLNKVDEIEAFLGDRRIRKYLNIPDLSGKTLLGDYIFEPSMILSIEALTKTIEGLVKAGVFIDTVRNYKDHSGYTALYRAIYLQQTALVEVLLDNGANVNTKNSAGDTPLLYAAMHGNRTIMRTLIFAGADYGRCSRSYECAQCTQDVMGLNTSKEAQSIMRRAEDEKKEALETLKRLYDLSFARLTPDQLETKGARYILSIAARVGIEYRFLARLLQDEWIILRSGITSPLPCDMSNWQLLQKIEPPKGVESLSAMIACAGAEDEQMMIRWLLRVDAEDVKKDLGTCSLCLESMSDLVKQKTEITNFSAACIHSACKPCKKTFDFHNPILPQCPLCKTLAAPNPFDVSAEEYRYISGLGNGQKWAEYKKSLTTYARSKKAFINEHELHYRKLKAEFYASIRAAAIKERGIAVPHAASARATGCGLDLDSENKVTMEEECWV